MELTKAFALLSKQ